MTGTASSTMPSGEFPESMKGWTTFSLLRARVFFWPLPFLMMSRRDSDSATRSKSWRRRLTASAPMNPSKYLPKRLFISR